MERNPRTLGTERMPRQPLAPWPPPGGYPYPILNEKDWGAVAARFLVDAKALIYFNFRTNNTDEVNWYLSHKVGCNKPTPDGFNWMFSPSARPGVIYIPVKKPVNMEGQTIIVRQGANELGRYLDGLDDFEPQTLQRLEHILDVFDFIHLTVGVAELEGALGVLSTGLEVLGAPAAELGAILAIVNAYEEGIAHIKKDWFLTGLSEGAVLGASGAENAFIRSYFVPGLEGFKDPRQPQEANNYRNAYLLGLVRGVAYGRQLNDAEAVKLIEILENQAGRHSGTNFKNWRDSVKKDYYEDLAVAFRRAFLPRL